MAIGRGNRAFRLEKAGIREVQRSCALTNLLEVRKHVVPIPALVTGQGGPPVVVIAATTVPDRKMNSRCSAECFATRVLNGAPIQTGLGGRREVPIHCKFHK
jgi:hypothetical protein